MADIEPPSFSLGLDFDFEASQPHPPSNLQTPKYPNNIDKGKEKATEQDNEDEDEEEEFNLRVSDSESDSPEKSTLTRLRRLRRGGPSSSKPTSSKPISNSIDDDDIEDFSDEDNNVIKNDHLAPHHQSSCSSSKLPLSGCGILMRQPESSTQNKKGKQDSSCPSTSLGSSKGKIVFPNLTTSPLRRFQLLDSDSDRDDPSDGVQIGRKASSVDCLKNNKKEESEIQARFKLLDSESEPDDPSAGVKIDRKASTADYSRKNTPKESDIYERFRLFDSGSDTDDPSDDLHINREASGVDKLANNKQKEANCRSYDFKLGRSTDPLPPTSQNPDPWKDFFANEKCSVPTPVFDELCDEYFKTVKSSKPAPSSQKFCSSDQGISMNNGKKVLQPQDSEFVVPPSHRYFLHDDLRIQRLVRSRLPCFCPLSTCGDAGYKSHNASSLIDYMSQFGQDGAKRNTGRQDTAEKSTKRGRKKTKNSNIEDTSLGSGDWIDPKQTARTPKDAGRRRVHADGQSAGHWFTAENGKKMGVVGENLKVDFIISTGDNFYDDGLTGVQDPAFYDSFTKIYTAASLQKPWFTVLGNHDYIGDVLAHLSLVLRQRDSRWISFRSYIVKAAVLSRCSRLLFVDTTPFVDKYFVDDEHNYDWRGVHPRDRYLSNLLTEVDEALKKSSAKWKFVIGHHPMLSAGSHGNTEELLVQLLPIIKATQNQKVEDAKELKELVRKQLVEVIKDPKEKLEYVDAILRLGVGYHFENEIEDNLLKFHNNLHFDGCYKDDLHYVSLRFHLLRQYGFYVSSDVFERFKCEDGNFDECLASDVRGLLSLYEASYLRVHGENILDEALAFATTCLTPFAAQSTSPMAKEIAHSLDLPLHKRSIRLESRYQISFYESKPSHDKTLLKFAKLDFNLLQKLHKKELRDLTRWSRSFDAFIKLPDFARDRLVETYFWSLGAYYEPHYAYGRMCFSKLLKIGSILDDIYDSYGKIEELEILTEAIERWDKSCKDQLPEYMRLFYVAILNTFEEVEQDLAKEERSFGVYYVREQLKVGCQGYLQEAKWCHEKFVPTYDAYVKNGLMSSNYLFAISLSFLGMGKNANREAFQWINKDSKAPRASCIYTRLINDLAGHKDERKINDVASAVECFMEQFGTSEEEAYKKIQYHMEEEWETINLELLQPNIGLRAPIMRLINLSRALHDFYQVGIDGYTMGKYLQPKVEAVLINPILI